MVTIRTYLHLAEAQVDQSFLQAAGIEAFLPDECTSTLGISSILEEGVRLQVSEEDAARALQLLEEDDRRSDAIEP